MMFVTGSYDEVTGGIQGQHEAGVFSSLVKNGRCQCTILIGGATLYITIPSQFRMDALPEPLELSIDLTQAETTVGGENNRLCFIGTKDKNLSVFLPITEAKYLLNSSSHHGVEAQKAALLGTLESHKQIRLKWWIIALIGVSLFAIASWATLQYMREHALDWIPFSADEALGTMALQAEKEDSLENAEVAEKELNKLMEKINAAIPENMRTPEMDHLTFRVHLIDNEMINAGALPGGEVLIFRGLLEAIPLTSDTNKAQWTAILAHEASHVVRRHTMSRLVSSAGILAIVQLMLGDVGGFAVVLATSLGMQSHSRLQETESDADAASILTALQLSPEHLGNALRTIESISRSKNKTDIEMPQWLQSHPDTEERRKLSVERASTINPTLPPVETVIQRLEIHWDRIQDHAVKKITNENPSELSHDIQNKEESLKAKTDQDKNKIENQKKTDNTSDTK